MTDSDFLKQLDKSVDLLIQNVDKDAAMRLQAKLGRLLIKQKRGEVTVALAAQVANIVEMWKPEYRHQFAHIFMRLVQRMEAQTTH